jgi:hypothetical protein
VCTLWYVRGDAVEMCVDPKASPWDGVKVRKPTSEHSLATVGGKHVLMRANVAPGLACGKENRIYMVSKREGMDRLLLLHYL